MALQYLSNWHFLWWTQQVLRKCVLNEWAFGLFGSWGVPCHWLNKSGRGYFIVRRGTWIVFVIISPPPTPHLLLPVTLHSSSFIRSVKTPCIGCSYPSSPPWFSQNDVNTLLWHLGHFEVQPRITSLVALAKECDLGIMGLSFFPSLWRQVIFKKDCLLGGSAIHLFPNLLKHFIGVNEAIRKLGMWMSCWFPGDLLPINGLLRFW